jgi:hypothetical protein
MSYDPNGGWGGQDQQWSGHDHPRTPDRGVSGGVLAAIVLLAVLALALLGALAYLVLRPGGIGGDPTGGAAMTTLSSSSVTPPPVTETAWSAPPGRETVTVTREAPRSQAPSDASYPAGADYSGWTGDRAARCNAGDPAAMIGRTTQAMFSICVNPDNGRYYYRGSSGGSGVEIDDPVVAGASATVSNNDVVYSIGPAEMVIYQGGQVISRQPMVDFWTEN